MKKRFVQLCITVVGAFLLLGLAGQAGAYGGYFSSNCATNCHAGITYTCAGCHAHGTHTNSAKNDINLTAVTDKAVYSASDTHVKVTLKGGYRPYWIRAILYDGDPTAGGAELTRCSKPGNNTPPGPSVPPEKVGCLLNLNKDMLVVPKPAPGKYTWYASWYGNRYDAHGGSGQGACFGEIKDLPECFEKPMPPSSNCTIPPKTKWRPDITNTTIVNGKEVCRHGEETIRVNLDNNLLYSFEVTSAASAEEASKTTTNAMALTAKTQKVH